MSAQHQALLGRLAPRWFKEIIVTDALRLLLEDEASRTAFLEFVGTAAGADVSAVTAFERERPVDRGQMDLQGVDPQGRPRLVIEVKFAHTMTTQQMTKYLRHQQEELAGIIDGALVLLVPKSRLETANAIMQYVAGIAENQSEDASRISCVALSWDACLDAMDAAHEDHPGREPSTVSDIVQLRSVCKALDDFTTPLEEVPDENRDQRLEVILDNLKGRVPHRIRKMMPLQRRDRDYSVFRYFGVPGRDRSWYSIGVVKPGVSELGASPLWWRFHKDTRDFDEVSRRLRRCDERESIRRVSGHLWLPLTVDESLAGPEMENDIVGQVEAILSLITD